jgi:predicted nucleotidyltransferase
MHDDFTYTSNIVGPITADTITGSTIISHKASKEISKLWWLANEESLAVEKVLRLVGLCLDNTDFMLFGSRSKKMGELVLGSDIDIAVNAETPFVEEELKKMFPAMELVSLKTEYADAITTKIGTFVETEKFLTVQIVFKKDFKKFKKMWNSLSINDFEYYCNKERYSKNDIATFINVKLAAC